MTLLSLAEKAAGRRFRDEQRELLAQSLAAEPPDLMPSLWAAHIRHNCAARGGLSTSFRMHEVYLMSPAYSVSPARVVYLHGQQPLHPDEMWDWIPEGRFAYFYKTGRCSCGLTGRSGRGQFVIAADRPPAGKS